MKLPYVYFGGKRSVATQIWQALGDVPHYIEPFFGGGAVKWLRPADHQNTKETVNDLDGFIPNFLRAVQHDPEAVARFADYPSIEVDLHARHDWLVAQLPILNKLLADPDWYDAKIAGWWVWGINNWIGSGWCDPKYYRDNDIRTARQIPYLRSEQGVQSIRTKRTMPSLRDNRGVQSIRTTRQIPFLNSKQGTQAIRAITPLRDYMLELSARLQNTRVCYGDWQRIMGRSVCTGIAGEQLTGVFLDPPYALSVGRDDVYNHETEVSAAVREWAIEHGNNPHLRIVLAGYADEHVMPLGWRTVLWKTGGGFGNQNSNGAGNKNAERECLWFSPHCIKLMVQLDMFGDTVYLMDISKDEDNGQA
jgi:hypothetical protein